MPDESPFAVRRAGRVTDLAEKDTRTASQNLPTMKVISMTFNMPDEWHRRFKVTASSRGLTMKELFEECFALYEKHNR